MMFSFFIWLRSLSPYTIANPVWIIFAILFSEDLSLRGPILTDATKTKKRIGKKYPYAQAPNVEFHHSA